MLWVFYTATKGLALVSCAWRARFLVVLAVPRAQSGQLLTGDLSAWTSQRIVTAVEMSSQVESRTFCVHQVGMLHLKLLHHGHGLLHKPSLSLLFVSLYALSSHSLLLGPPLICLWVVFMLSLYVPFLFLSKRRVLFDRLRGW